MDVTSKVLLGLDAAEFRRGIQQVDSQLKQTSKNFANLGAMIGASFAGAEIIAFGKECINLAAEAENVQVAFANIGTSAQLTQLQQATDGEISKLKLMERAVKAVGQGTGIADLATQLDYANKVSDATGIAFDEIADKLQTAFAKESTKGLEQAGINVKEMKEQLAAGVPYAEALGNAMKNTLDIIGPGVESAADAIDRQRASIEDLKLQIGTALLPVYAGFLSFVSEGLKALNALLSNQLSLYEKLSYLASYVLPNGGAMRLFLDGLKASREALEDTTIAAPKLGLALTDAVDKVKPNLKKTTDGFKELLDLIEQVLAGERQLRKATVGELERGLREDVTNNYQPISLEALDENGEGFVELQQKVKDFSNELQFAANIGAEFGGILTQAFTASLTNGENFFKVLGKALQTYVAQLIAAVAATVALSAIVSSITGVSFKDTFKAMQGSMGGMANLFGGGNMNMKATVSGNDLNLGVQRSGNNIARIGG
jgi:hypothetical protein